MTDQQIVGVVLSCVGFVVVFVAGLVLLTRTYDFLPKYDVEAPGWSSYREHGKRFIVASLVGGGLQLAGAIVATLGA